MASSDDRPLFPFFAEQNEEEHRGELHWPGLFGLPYRGSRQDLRQDEQDTKLAVAVDYHSAWFQLWDAEQKRAFDALQQKIANGWYVQKNRVDRFDEQHGDWRIWLEWLQRYVEPAKEVPQHALVLQQDP